jgi:hypothetical protein
MRVLAIDTALAACAAAVLDTGHGIVASESLPMLRGHAEALLPLIARVMKQSETNFRDLDRIAVTIGPGSFTGVRVGLAAARTMAAKRGVVTSRRVKPKAKAASIGGFRYPRSKKSWLDAPIERVPKSKDGFSAETAMVIWGLDKRTTATTRLPRLTVLPV